jgi:hypothetical protein
VDFGGADYAAWLATRPDVTGIDILLGHRTARKNAGGKVTCTFIVADVLGTSGWQALTWL